MSAVFDRVWSNLHYDKNSLSLLPWHNENLDAHLNTELTLRNITGGRFLDIGTGHGTQSNQLQLAGFSVVGTDINKCFLDHARSLNPHVDYKLDNIVVTGLQEKFDYVFDRGCYHWLQKRFRSQYVKNVKQLVDKLFFLKVIEKQDPIKLPGASEQEIVSLFEQQFTIESVKRGQFNNNDDSICSLFFVMRPHR